MIAVVWPLSALLAGVALLLAGSGLLGTLLGVRGTLEGFGERTLGLVMSGYFAGFLLGTYAAPALIQRVGHVRAFAFYTGLCAIAVLLHPLWVHPVGWFVLRVQTGIALVGLYTVIESWLNAHAPPEQRSGVFAVYMVVNLTALAGGQLLLGFGVDRGFALFSLVAILICAAALPVTLTRLTQPVLPSAPRLHLRKLAATAPAASVAAALSGVAMGGFWGLGAVYAERIGLDRLGIAWFMVATILGGAVWQWPLGRWSDRVDRRRVLLQVSLVAALLAACAIPAATWPALGVYALFFLYGGVAFALYPLSVAHLLDTLPRQDLLAGGSGLLLVHGVGAAVGPTLAGWAMQHWGASALPASFAGTWLVLAGWLGWRLYVRPRHTTPQGAFHPMVRTTPAALALLPETDADASTRPDPAAGSPHPRSSPSEPESP